MVDFQIIPLKGTYQPGQVIDLQIILPDSFHVKDPVELGFKIWKLMKPIADFSETILCGADPSDLVVSWSPPAGMEGGFGIACQMIAADGRHLGSASTAFDILEHWTKFPRYGFLCDFSPGRTDLDQTFLDLTRFHINGLQYYDWQYRHDRLISPEEEYLDPLGRELSLDTVSQLLRHSQLSGIKAMPYLAVYAASREFWEDHPEWALYDEDGEPYSFEDFLGIMDPSPNSPWIDHLKRECARVVSEFPFDGLHVDQYGEPRSGFTSAGKAVDLPLAFQSFINDLKSDHRDAVVVFNAVKNWPIEDLAASRQDFMYIEIWPPNTTYQELGEIVKQARLLSAGKPVVIAAYIPASQEANVRLADAVIFAHGGTRIEIGEGDRLLVDPYFPNHQPLPSSLNSALQRYCDFLVCYGDLIGPAQKRSWDQEVISPEGMTTTTCVRDDFHSICLINQNGINDLRWDEKHGKPAEQNDFIVEIELSEMVNGVWWGSPDEEDWKLHPVDWEQDGDSCRVKIARLEYWGALVISTQSKEFSR